MEFDKTLLAGSTGMMVLKLLEQEDMYGYQMIETLRERSEHSFDLLAVRRSGPPPRPPPRRGPPPAVLPPDGRRPQASV